MEREQVGQPTGAPAYPAYTDRTQNGNRQGGSSNGACTQDDDPPRKRRLLFPKARPKKMHEFLGRQLNASGDLTEGADILAPKPIDASSQPPPHQADAIEAVVCGGRSFEEILAAAGIDSDPQGLVVDEACKQRPSVRRQKLKCTTSDNKALDSTTISTSLSCQSPETASAPMAVEDGASCSDDIRAISAASPPHAAATSLLDSSCLGVQRLTLRSPSGSKANTSSQSAGFVNGKSPPEKRPSSGAFDLVGGDAVEELGDGGLGPLQKAEDFSSIPLATRLQSRAVKQRVHGCDEVVARLSGCKTFAEKVRLWDEVVKSHFSGILKDTNALVGSKALEMLLALVKNEGGADSTCFPASAALPLLQQNGKLIVSHILPNPRHFSSCCEVMLTLSQASAECATETVALIASVDQQLLDERKGNVAAIKGQGLRILGSTIELLLQMLQAFGIQLVIELGGVKGLIQPISCFASCSDKRVRSALSSLSATSVYLAKQAAGEGAAATAKKTVLECLKTSKSMHAEVEQLLGKFSSEPPPASSRTIAGTGGQACTSGQAQVAGNTGGRGANSAAILVEETDILRVVCQQQTDWVLRVTEGKQSVAHGDREGGEEPPWKVKLQAWQQLESALRDCASLYKKNPFLQQQLLPLLHRVLTVEPTLPVVTCALKTTQLLTQLLLQPRGGEGSQQLQQHLRVLLPDILAKLKMNNRPVQAAACACLGTFLCCLPIDVVVGDLLPMKEKLANYQKLLLDELAKAVRQQGGTPALHRAAALLFAAAKFAAEDGNATVRSSGVNLLAALATHAESSAVVGEAMQKLPEQKRLQLQKALASASTAASSGASQPPLSPSRSTMTPGNQGLGMPFSRMRSRGAVGSVPLSSASASAERQVGGVAPGQSKAVRKQNNGYGSAGGKVSMQRYGCSVATAAVSASSALAPSPPGGSWEVPHVTIGSEEAEERARELFPQDLLQGLDAPAGHERRRAYSALEAWSRHSCHCRLCNCGSVEGHMETDENNQECRLETFRKSAVHILLYLRTKFRGFRERTAVLEEACISCLKSVIGGLLLPADIFKATTAGAKNSASGLSSLPATLSNQGRRLPPVDRSVVGVVFEPLVDRLGDPRVGNDVLSIGLLLARCVETPTSVAAQVALQAEGRVGGGRIMQGVCSLLEQLLQQWGLQAFTPPKQLLMIVRHMLEPNKGTRSVAFPLLKRLHAEMGSKNITAMLVSYPLPDDIKNALKREEQQQPQQQQQQHAPEGSGPPWNAALVALTSGAAAVAAAVAGIACNDSPQLRSSEVSVSVAQHITQEMLQRLQHGQEEAMLKSLHELMDIFVSKIGDRIKPEGLSTLVTLLRKRLGDSSACVRRQVLFLLVVFCDRLGGDASTNASGTAPTFSARVYKQILPAVAECLCDLDKKVVQAAHFATAKWIAAVGIGDALQLLQPILLSSNSAGSSAAALPSQRAFAGAALRRALSGGLSGAICPNKNVKLRDTLLSLMALTMPIEAAREAVVLRILVPHLLDALQAHHRSEVVAGATPASVLLSLLIHEGCQRESVAEVLRQRLAIQGIPAAASPAADSALSSLLVSEDTVKLLCQARQEIKAVHMNPVVPLLRNGAQAEPPQQESQSSYREGTLREGPASSPASPARVNCAGVSAAFLSTRSQRIQRSSGTGFLTSRRHQFGARDELYNELKGRLQPSLLLLMFPLSCAAPSTTGNRQGLPPLSQLKAAYDAWSELFSVETGLKYPLQGEQSITDLMLRWTAQCISETQQQQRTAQAQECLCVLLQMLHALLQPYCSMRVTLPLHEQQQILQQLLDVASNASSPPATGASAPKRVAKHLRHLVREALLLLAAIAEDRTKFLSAIHRSLIRCKNKELLVDLMAAMTRALGQHVQTQLQTKGGTTSGNEALSDFLSQQCAARFFTYLVDPKASSEQRSLAFDFLVFCNLAVKGGALHLLPSLSPDCRARLVEATKQIAATGLSQSRLDNLIPRQHDPCCTMGEDSTEKPTKEAHPTKNLEPQADEAGCGNGAKRSGPDQEGLRGTSTSSSAMEGSFQEAETSCTLPEPGNGTGVESSTTALAHAVAQADALLRKGGEELQQQASALQGWLTATKELRMESKVSEAALTSLRASPLERGGALALGKKAQHEYSREGSIGGIGEVGSPVEQLCCITAVRTWCAELQLRSLSRAVFGAHCLLFLLTSVSPNPSSAAATATRAAVSAATQGFIDAAPSSQLEGCSPHQHSEHALTKRSGRQHIHLTPIGEAVLSAHRLCFCLVLEGITKALDFFFEEQHYGALYSAGLSLQGAASALLLADIVTRRRMQQYKTLNGSKQKGAALLSTHAVAAHLEGGVLQPLADKRLLQRCCSCLLRCMGRYQNHLYKSPIAMDSRLGTVRFLVTFLLNQVLGKNILHGDLRVLSCIAESCFAEAAQALGSPYRGTQSQHTDTLWRLVSKVHKKTLPFLEKYGAAALQPAANVPESGISAMELQRHLLALSILEMISIVVTSLSLLDGSYNTARLLIEQRRQQQRTPRQPPLGGHEMELTVCQQKDPLTTLQKDRMIFLLHAKLFMYSFASLCPTLLGIHLKAVGIAESEERSAWLEGLLRSSDRLEGVDGSIEGAGGLPRADGCGFASQVRGAEEACNGLRTFSCAEITAKLEECSNEKILISHRKSLEKASRLPTEDEAMQVDSPSSGDGETSTVVKTALKGWEETLRAFVNRTGINPTQDPASGPSSSVDHLRPSFGGDSIEEQPYDSNDDFTLHPLLQKVRQCLFSPSQQRVLLQRHPGVPVLPSGKEVPKDRNALHMVRFCSGTAAALPHHKLATLRADAENPDSIPKNWLDFASVAHSYKLDAQLSQITHKTPETHAEAQATSDSQQAGRKQIEASDCARSQRISQLEKLPSSSEPRGCAPSPKEMSGSTQGTSFGSTPVSLLSKQARTMEEDGAAVASGNYASPALPLHDSHQLPPQGFTGGASPMRHLGGGCGYHAELQPTPMTASKLPQCGATKPTGSAGGSHERRMHGESASAIKNTFLVKSCKEPPCNSVPASTDAH